MEAIEAHPQDSFSLPRVDRNIYVCLSRNVFRARGAQHTPMNDIFFCLEWLKVKPSALNLSQALLFRKSGKKKNTHTQTNKKQVMPRDCSQTAFQETRAGKNIGQILPQASNKKNLNPGILSYEVLLTCPMINPVAFICPSPHSLPSPALYFASC